MKLVPYDDALLHEIKEPDQRNQVTALASEVAVRIIEFYEINPCKCIIFLQQLLHVYRTSPESFQLTLQVLSGSGDEKRSYTEIGKQKGTSRQYQHKKRHTELAKLEKQFPQVAKILKSSLWTNKK